MNNRIKYYESENEAIRTEREKILGQAKRIRSAFEEQISSARAKHLEESNHVELRTQELIQSSSTRELETGRSTQCTSRHDGEIEAETRTAR